MLAVVSPAKVKVPAPFTVTEADAAMPRLAVSVVLTVAPLFTVRFPGATTLEAVAPARVSVPALTKVLPV